MAYSTLGCMRELNLRENKQYSVATQPSFTIYSKEMCELNQSYLSKDEELRLFEKIKHGCNDSRNVVIHHNLKLIPAIANKFRNSKSSLQFEDLVSEGNLALIKAVGGFKPELNIRFASYASMVIRTALMQFIANNINVIKMNSGLKISFYRFKNIQDMLETELGYIPSDTAIVEYALANNIQLNYHTKNVEVIVESMRTASIEVCSIDSVDEGGEFGHIDFLEADSIPLTPICAIKDNILMEVIEALPPFDKMLIKYSFGFNSDKMFDKDIAAKLSLSIKDVRLFRAEIMAELRINNKLKNIKIEVDNFIY